MVDGSGTVETEPAETDLSTTPVEHVALPQVPSAEGLIMEVVPPESVNGEAN
jgi:hypothetical protein